MSSSSQYISNFKRNVTDKYVIYNSLFAALPFSGIANVGALLPILLQACIDGYAEGKTPMQIIDHFFKQHTNALSDNEKMDRLFKFVQYIERQIVLFDAIEDAAFTTVNNMDGAGSLKALFSEAAFAGKTQSLKNKLRKFKVRVVLTAHPTQFYPGSVLGIIHDMNEAISKNDFHTINQYIEQLGITPFFNKKQPTPYDEAVNLMWYLENILYQSIGNIYNYIAREVFDNDFNGDNPFIELGFWPGGDRDGNPFVTSDITLKVAEALRSAIIVCYYRDVRKLVRRLTFTGVDTMIHTLEQQLYENVFRPYESKSITADEILQQLLSMRQMVVSQHHSLFLQRLDSLIHKVKIFGTHFAALDIRQDSRIHTSVLANINTELRERGENGILPDNYTSLSPKEKMGVLAGINTIIDPDSFKDELVKETLKSMCAISTIQQRNGIQGCQRYIISNCQGAVNVMEVYALAHLCGWPANELTIDIVPLFETIDDLKAAEGVMESLYSLPAYNQHLHHRNKQQTIMLGFSDGTKDGGYLQANWSIYTAKENLTAISRKYSITSKFFDGRGGPPSRGGGKTNKFYASLGHTIENEEIQLTIQGQTITSNFGTIQSSQYNLEQLLSAGISNELFSDQRAQISAHDRHLMEELGRISYEAYQSFKNHPLFMSYLQQFSPLDYYSKSNIASRPSKRGGGGELKFEDLRAVPFVGSWSQLKQNVPGYFGVGTALQKMKDSGSWNDVKALFRNVLFFRTLVDNSMMSMLKSNFAPTQFIKDDPTYGPIWKLIKDEFDLTARLVLELSSSAELMQDDKTGRASIQMRDKIVLPLLTIQQYALFHLHDTGIPAEMKETYEKLVTRSMFGIINAARNSA
jgi:phosphoenolpyruvate carboxylase